MPFFTKESLENLRQRVDLVEVLNSYMDLKPAGASYKGLCPFHDEKSPSFVVQRGDHHYHCFGCSAHGDAITFLMENQRMSFNEAVEALAHKFNVILDYEEATGGENRVNKKPLYDALDLASRFYHFCLLHTEEGHQALEYLYSRSIDLDFIKRFQIGLAPSAPQLFQNTMKEKKIDFRHLLEAGLLKEKGPGQFRDFFYDRITFPIHNPSGQVIGFSARKYKDDTFGGKYVNSPETPVFKKSRVLFGLNYSRRSIAKQQKAMIVEGQIDALRLIHEGFDITVAGQGTAFGQEHVQELTRLGVRLVYLALDSDQAGKEAALKIGHLFQKKGVEVSVVEMPAGLDPDSFIREHGADLFTDLVNGGVDYLTYLVRHFSLKLNMDSPAEKNRLVTEISGRIREWESDLMVHESLKKLGRLTQTPEEFIGISQRFNPNVYVKQSGTLGEIRGHIDPHRILESDLLRWLIVSRQERKYLQDIVKVNLQVDDFKDSSCRQIYQFLLENNFPLDLLAIVSNFEPEQQEVLVHMMNRKVNPEQAEEVLTRTVGKILERNWMEKRDAIHKKIQTGDASEEETLQLLRDFDALKNAKPVVNVPEKVDA